MIEEALVALLETDAAVAALVDDRIYPIVAPAGVDLPAIVYQRISGPRAETMAGPSGLAWPRFQFGCIGGSFSEAVSVADAVRQALDGYRGTVSGVVIRGILLLNEFSQYEADEDEGGVSWVEYLDFGVYHLE